DATLKIIEKIANRDGVGDIASQGVKAVSKKIGKGSEKFAVHVKGHELAAWNVHADPARAICYATANRGACHLNGNDPREQNARSMLDSLGVCLFAEGGYKKTLIRHLLSAITGKEWTSEEYMTAGERIFNLEKMFNYREGFGREDDRLPDRFFEEPLTVGPRKGAVLEKVKFNEAMNQYYEERGWDPQTTRPGNAKLKSLGLSFAMDV
ncbi:MAG: aldehyde ferredoxin oxidoreductase C-terminal domain-containing protein, partial [Deltaproteobacteria bacterium]|nr:aldehyde ferredoxin oxidoreductase C-terminal domain-containing protein [Deltaproteobacteria bacterium]